MNFPSVMEALARELKIDLAEAVAAGGCTIRFDGMFDVHVEEGPDDSVVQIYAPVLTVPAQDRERLFMLALEAHMFGYATDGASFGYHRDQNHLVLFRTLSLQGLDEPVFVKILEGFVNQVETWRGKLLDIEPIKKMERIEPTVFIRG